MHVHNTTLYHRLLKYDYVRTYTLTAFHSSKVVWGTVGSTAKGTLISYLTIVVTVAGTG